MAYIIIDAPQRSDAWRLSRLGRLCASDAGKMLTGGKEAKTRGGLRDRLVAERLKGKSEEDGYTNADMERGIELEPVARIAYQDLHAVLVREVGFLQSVEHMAGASPDGVIGDMEGLIEIKCPRTSKHLSHIKAGIVPAEYRPQMLHQMWISGAPWVDFVSFDPGLPERLQLFVVRFNRNEAEIAEYERTAVAFLREVDIEVASWQTCIDHNTQMVASL